MEHKDYKGRKIEIGDTVIHVFGKNLRTSEVIGFEGPQVKVKGLVAPIRANRCLHAYDIEYDIY